MFFVLGSSLAGHSLWRWWDVRPGAICVSTFFTFASFHWWGMVFFHFFIVWKEMLPEIKQEKLQRKKIVALMNNKLGIIRKVKTDPSWPWFKFVCKMVSEDVCFLRKLSTDIEVCWDFSFEFRFWKTVDQGLVSPSTTSSPPWLAPLLAARSAVAITQLLWRPLEKCPSA